ncbi:thiol reductase thioredoxin [Oscillatoriales cyanobacterium USR001]|nr:thiol reductase thioredoxin [Oscillatoriales cyanobacterium USR001]
MLLSVSERTFSQTVFESNTPVLVHFWAPWCGVCRVIDPLLNQFEESWAGQVKVVGINADSSLKLASTYKLTTLPTLILFDGGKVLFRFENFQGREDLRRTLDAFMQSYDPSPQRQILQPQSAVIRA